MGTGALATGTNTTAVGDNAVASGNFGVALGNGALASADNSVALGNATGFDAAIAFPVGIAPRDVAVGDLDRDGALDLAIAHEGNADVVVLFGDGLGDFGSLGGTLSMKGRALIVEHANTGSRWNSQWKYTLPSGETIAFGGLPKGELRCTESSAAMSKAVMPLVRTTPILST